MQPSAINPQPSTMGAAYRLALQKLLLVGLVSNIITTEATTSLSKSSNCSDSCGSVSIPYPFGTSPDCYFNESFLITCNHSFRPPRPFFPGSNVSILDISLDVGELRIESPVSRDCYNERGNLSVQDSVPTAYTVTFSRFPLSRRNKLVAVGCDTVGGVLGGYGGRFYGTGCVSLCNGIDTIINGSCTGLGCCQIPVPDGVRDFATASVSFASNHTRVYNISPCGYAFIVEQESYNFSSLDLKGLRNRDTVPVVLDWAIGNITCEQAKRDLAEYACKARHSQCLNSTNGLGYRCKCLEGFQGNPYLLGGCQDINECERSYPCVTQCTNLIGSYECSKCPKGFKGDGKRNGKGCSHEDRTNRFAVKISIALSVCTALMALLVGASWIYWGAKKRKVIKLREKFFQQNGGLLLQQGLSSQYRGSAETAKIFTANELNKATNNYDRSRVIGQGGYGTVYKGVLADNKVVAIKKSKIEDQSQIDQFINEVIVLSQINHRNVVKLLGCCLETEVPLLVYEFITNGTLSDHIHNKAGQYSSLSWAMRLKIATETAGAIAYLHSSTSMPIIHRDIKTANILLDENYVAKVSDFGASRLVPLDQTQLTTLVQGTLGYLDPEYFHTSLLTEKSDVYSFGVVLAELLTGQKALSFDRPEGDRNLALFFTCSLKDDLLLEILDDNLATRAAESVESIKTVANLARGCLRVRGDERPAMKEVYSELEGLIPKEMHPWRRHDQDEHFSLDDTEYLLKSSDHRIVGEKASGGHSNTSSIARLESINKEMLQSYGDGR